LFQKICMAVGHVSETLYRLRTLSIQPKIQELGQMVRKFPGEVSVKLEDYWIFPKCELFNGKFRIFREENQMRQKFPVRNFRKFGLTSRGCPLFRKLRKMLFHSPLEISSPEVQTRMCGRMESALRFFFLTTIYSAKNCVHFTKMTFPRIPSNLTGSQSIIRW